MIFVPLKTVVSELNLSQMTTIQGISYNVSVTMKTISRPNGKSFAPLNYSEAFEKGLSAKCKQNQWITILINIYINISAYSHEHAKRILMTDSG